MVRKLIDQMKRKHLITAKQAHYLYGPDLPRARLFYLLPKIHKPPEKLDCSIPGPPGSSHCERLWGLSPIAWQNL